MIDLYYHPSPNTRKVRMALQELDLEHRIESVDITGGEQFAPEFLQINPNGKVPAIVDHDGPGGGRVALFESCAILLYLSSKTDRLMPREPGRHAEAVCWLFWQAANQGPGLGNATFFHSYAPDLDRQDDHARDRFVLESERCYAILEERLRDRPYLFDELSMVDIACFPWTRVSAGHGVSLDRYHRVKEWSDRMAARPSARMVDDGAGPPSPRGGFTPGQASVLFPG